MRHFFTAFAACTLLAACDPLSLTALGIGGSTAVSQKMNSATYRTFTAPIARVKVASLAALRRMGIQAGETTKVENGELIVAQVGKRDIQVELESLTPTATRMSVVARDGVLAYDKATASEIIAQTGKVLGI